MAGGALNASGELQRALRLVRRPALRAVCKRWGDTRVAYECYDSAGDSTSTLGFGGSSTQLQRQSTLWEWVIYWDIDPSGAPDWTRHGALADITTHCATVAAAAVRGGRCIVGSPVTVEALPAGAAASAAPSASPRAPSSGGDDSSIEWWVGLIIAVLGAVVCCLVIVTLFLATRKKKGDASEKQETADTQKAFSPDPLVTHPRSTAGDQSFQKEPPPQGTTKAYADESGVQSRAWAQSRMYSEPSTGDEVQPGDRVLAPFDGEYHPGTVAQVHDDSGTVLVNWDDGTHTDGVPVDGLRDVDGAEQVRSPGGQVSPERVYPAQHREGSLEQLRPPDTQPQAPSQFRSPTGVLSAQRSYAYPAR